MSRKEKSTGAASSNSGAEQSCQTRNDLYYRQHHSLRFEAAPPALESYYRPPPTTSNHNNLPQDYALSLNFNRHGDIVDQYTTGPGGRGETRISSEHHQPNYYSSASTREYPYNYMNDTCSSVSEASPSATNSSRLTIIYADDVYVYDNVIPEQAKAVMSAASCSEAAGAGRSSSKVNVVNMSKQPSRQLVHQNPPPSILAVGSELHSVYCSSSKAPCTISEARKASMLRFLAKRNSR